MKHVVTLLRPFQALKSIICIGMFQHLTFALRPTLPSELAAADGGSRARPSGSGTAEPEEPDTGQLPEGFFDDPQKDAKVRQRRPSVR